MSIFDDIFPGNASVMERLLKAMEGGGVAAFTGAGTSMPSLPGWSALVKGLVNDAEREGLIDLSTASALRSEHKDYLYVIDELYSAAGEGQTKSKVAKIYNSLDRPTKAHSYVISAKFERLITLNYDAGLEMAFADQRSQHIQGITCRNLSEVDQWIRRESSSQRRPVLHWHGLASDADSIILSGSDYVKHYDSTGSNREALRNIFKSWSVLLIGFGFADMFIERELNSVMQPIPKSNSHFAIIGIADSDVKDIRVERRKYSSKYKIEPIFYPVRESDLGPDHSALIEILEHIVSNCSSSSESGTPGQDTNTSPQAKDQSVNYRSSLFTIGDRAIYCEPNIWLRKDGEGHSGEQKASFQDLMSAETHCNIVAPHEYGLSNLGRRLAAEIDATGIRSIFRDATGFPKYRKAILSERAFSDLPPDEHFVLILDNYLAVEHQRAIRELLSIYSNIRIYVLQKASFAGSTDNELANLGFRTYLLTGFSRSDIRSTINLIAPFFNSDDTSIIVDKVYEDLLNLSIPLTPSNVIMYCSVLCKDGSFSPVSRLHIVERFISEALQRASDAYADTFNAINKGDLVSEFCYNLFMNETTSFFEMEWRNFCEAYKAEKLVDFNSTEILGDLINGRIVIKDGSKYFFRYRMFYSYFAGRHISSHSELLIKCISDNRHLEVDGLIEVLCGTLTDCSLVLDDLTSKLTTSMEEFYRGYPIAGFDFHENVVWRLDKEESGLWSSVAARLDKGPATTQELDELKTSLSAERRTDTQKVTIIKFIASEKYVTSRMSYVSIALESAKNASAASKKAAASAVINGLVLAYEVASVFVPLIADKKYVSWNGFTYINLIEYDKQIGTSLDKEEEKKQKEAIVIDSLPSSMGCNASDSFGTRKLGQVFLALSEAAHLETPIKRFILFCLILRSKPGGWLQNLKKRVGTMKRDDIYLRHMLSASMNQYRSEINNETERHGLKELIASIRLRRDVNLKLPSATQIRQAIGKLEAGGVWSEKDAELQ